MQTDRSNNDHVEEEVRGAVFSPPQVAPDTVERQAAGVLISAAEMESIVAKMAALQVFEYVCRVVSVVSVAP